MHKVSQAAMMVIGGAACAGPGGMIMRTSIRTTAMLAVLVLGWSSISAATPEEAYIEARDAAIAKIKAAVAAETRLPTAAYGDRILTTEKQARADLEQQMRTIIGPVSIDGLDRTGALNLDTLIEGDQGFGALDGMIYGPVDAKTRVIVTTESLLRRWLGEHKNWWGKDFEELPQEPGAAIKQNGFYTQALVTDAAIVRFADLPVRKPATASFAFAMLGARTQSDVPAKADEIFLAIAQGGRVFVAHTTAFAAVGPIASCNAVREEHRQPISDALSAKSASDFLRCFAEKAREQDGFAAATAAAQSLIDRVVPR